MSKFVELNVPGVPEYDQEFTQPSFFKNDNICVCCLAQNVPFVSLISCKHALECNFLFDLKLQYPLQLICGQCHCFIMKIAKFQEQVENSIQLLAKKSTLLKQEKTILNLKKTPTEISWAVDSEPIKMMIEKNNDNTIYTDHSEVIFSNDDYEFTADSSVIEESTDAKSENKKDNKEMQNNSNFECSEVTSKDITMGSSYQEAECSTAVGFMDIKIKLEHVDGEFDDVLDFDCTKKRRKKVSEEILDKYEGKIKLTTLTVAEFYAEKEAEKTKNSYSNLPFKCEHCVVAFDHEVSLKEHNEKKHTKKESNFECDFCKSYFASRHSYLDHRKRHFKRYECVACSKRYSTLQSACEHYKQQHGETVTQTFTCDKCDFTSNSNRKYRYHRQKHKEKEQCTLCGKTFVTKSSLKNHMLTQHEERPRAPTELRYRCKVCDKAYNTKTGLKHHQDSVHEKSVAYCVTCQVHFRTRSIYMNHLATNSKHVNAKLSCEECDGKFLTKAALKHHINYVHRRTIGHRCDRCDKVFPLGRALRRHQDFVHDKKQLPKNKMCDHCGKGFTTLSILRAHVRTHTGERPLRCSHCAASFAHPAALYNHRKLLHNTLAHT